MISTINILGVNVSAIDMTMALHAIDDWIQRRQSHYVCVTGVHGVMESRRRSAIRRIHNSAGMVAPDGMPLVWLSRIRGYRGVNRVYGPDLMLEVCKRSPRHGYRHFLYGGAPGIADRLATNLQSRFPGLLIAGTHCPPFRALSPAEDEQVVDRINSSRADIVWVGISTPKQELWMSQHVHRLNAPVLIGVGAAFDFHAGVKRQAPRWMMRTGLEWLFRLLQEPRRLGPRYLVNNPAFLCLVLFDSLVRLRANVPLLMRRASSSLPAGDA